MSKILSGFASRCLAARCRRPLMLFAACCFLFTSACIQATDAPPIQSNQTARDLIQSKEPLVISHRGYSKLAPENTLPSFRLAIGARADLVELDYYHSKDGVPMVSHDASLERATDARTRLPGPGLAVGDYSAADLARLDAGKWFAPVFAGTALPTLKQALDTIQPGSTTLIERKGGDPNTLIGLLKDWGQTEKVVVQSFDWEFVRACRSLSPTLTLGALGPPSEFKGRKLNKDEKQLNAEFIRAIHETGAQLVVWNKEVTAESVALAQKEGLIVWVYTIDVPAEAAALVKLGVKGIITNDPEPIAQAIGRGAVEYALPPLPRSVPEPLSGHPGNVFLEGEPMSVQLSNAAPAAAWKAIDVDGRICGQGTTVGTNRIELPPMRAGWYRIEYQQTSLTATGWTSAAVLSRLKAPTPADSPICLDTAMSWFARNNETEQRIYANLAALAGANWSRDRLRWSDIQTGPETFAPQGNYDKAAAVQQHAGLRTLQVFHDTPRWAQDGDNNHGRFAADLRIAYRFCREMGRRFQNQAAAWEPWNEANIDSFGGHAMDEIASWQKACWLGFRASGAKILVGYNAMAAVPTWRQTESVLLNEVQPYFDTYNIHTYDWSESYKELWEPARAASSGKPLWITEADRGAMHDKTAPWYDLPPRLERLKAEYLAQSYASALMAGADRFFQFILGNYQEPNGVQFGLLRLDFTPRPAYSAFAAAGRLLAGAKPLGRWETKPDVHVHAFHARPDGIQRDVIVAWTEKNADWDARGQSKARCEWPEKLKPVEVFDFMGRSLGQNWPEELTSAPIFAILPRGHASILPLTLPLRSKPAGADTLASPMVLQAVFPKSTRVSVEDRPWSGGYAYRIKSNEKTAFDLCFYNFSEAKTTLSVSVQTMPKGWQLSETKWECELAPMERMVKSNSLSPATAAGEDGWIVLRGKSPGQPDAALAFRVLR